MDKGYVRTSPVAEYIDGLLTEKRALGFSYMFEEYVLNNFDHYCIAHGLQEPCFSRDFLQEWLCVQGREGASYHSQRISFVRQLALYMNSIGINAYIPVESVKKEINIPHFLSPLELDAFFSSLDGTEPGTEDFRRALGECCVLNAWCKRKSNLLLLNGKELPERNRELFLALQESARFLKCCGVEAAAVGEETADFPLSDIHDLYDAFETVIEAWLPSLRRMTVSLTDGGILDFITMETPSLEALAQSGRLTDLNLERCQELRDRYADRLVYFHGVEGDIPVGFDVSDSLLVTRYGVYKDSCAIGIGARSEKMDTIALFMRFILEEK